MVWFLLFLFVLFLTVGLVFLTLVKERRTENRWGNTERSGFNGRPIGVALVALAFVVLGASCFNHVGSNEVGIVNNFNTYQRTDKPGIHLTAPWSSTEKFSTRLQIQGTKAEDLKLKPSDPKAVGAPAYAEYTVRWKIDGTKHAVDLWRNLRDFDAVWEKLVKPESVTSAKEVLGNYLPNEATNGANVRKIGDELERALQRAVDGKGVVIDSISVTAVKLKGKAEEQQAAVQAADAAAQKRAVEAESRQKTAAIDAQTRLDTATKDKDTARQQAEADRLRKSTATRETLVQECLRLAEKLGKPMDCNYYLTNQYAPVPR